MKSYSTKVGKLLLYLQLLIGVSAFLGGIGLILTNGLGMPISALKGTLFSSYLIPGVILAVIVGGAHLTAAGLVVRKRAYAVEMSAIAAFGLLIWLFTEVSILSERNILQSIYFGLAIMEIILTFLESTFIHHDALLRSMLTGERSRL